MHFEIEFTEPSINDTVREISIERFFEDVITYCFYILTRLATVEKKFRINEKKLRAIEEKLRDKIPSKKHKELTLGLFSSGKNLSNIDKEDIIWLIDSVHEILSKFKGKESAEVAHAILYFRNNITSRALLDNRSELIMIYDFLKKIEEIEMEKISLEYDFNYVDSVLQIKTFKINLGGKKIATVNFDKALDNKSFIESDIIDFSKIDSKQIAELKKAFKNNKTVFSFIENYEYNEQNPSVFCYYYINFISKIVDRVEESFNMQRINYVSPLRAHPKRYYFLDKAKVNTFLDTLDGEAIAEILKENSGLRNNVNSWFKKFNLQIDVGPIKDIIHQIVVKQNSLDLDITDVGFGVSQVLPVIIQGFLSKEKSITLIEQPEIHLHPKMQADLADLFIDIAITKDRHASMVDSKYLIIETHSEYLLKRLRRRISEKIITAEQVAIYYIERDEDTKNTVINHIDISETGAFDWPKDFYTGDLADDVTKFLKNQI